MKIGFFTLGRALNLPKVERQFGALVEGKKDYFHLGDEEAEVAEQYAVIRSFRDYNFSASHVGLEVTIVPRRQSKSSLDLKSN